MKRNAIRLLMVLIALAVVVPFFYPRHKPILSWQEVVQKGKTVWQEELNLPELPSLPNPTSDEVTVYRWQDTQGGWHFSSTAPENVDNYQSMAIDPDANLMQSGSTQAEKANSDRKSSGSGTLTIGDETYSANEVAELIGQARVARDALRQHEQTQKEMIDQ